MKLKVIACGVFQGLLDYVASKSQNEIAIEYLEAGLHSNPRKLHECAKEAIETAEESEDNYGAIALCYGLCGRGVVGLAPKRTTLVMPRGHDCITLFLGSVERYRKEFSKFPGSYYFCQSWLENKGHPQINYRRAENNPEYTKHKENYGAANANYILDFYNSWRKNYQRAAYVTFENDRPIAQDEYVPKIEALAAREGWRFERLDGDMTLLMDLLNGDWDEKRFLIVRSGEKIIVTPEGGIVEAIPLDIDTPELEGTVEEESEEYTPPRFTGDERIIGLGIDAGGTYTDSVIYEFCALSESEGKAESNGKILSKSKALTTKDDLTRGITASVDGLDRSLFDRIGFVSISTTLATNAIVEGKGGAVALIVLLPPGFRGDDIKHEPKSVIKGMMDMDGNEREALDHNEIQAAVKSLLERGDITAFAVSGYASIRNPKHELRVKDVIQKECDLPVLCGHELSMELNFIRRANTAVLNAKLMPIIADLIDAVKEGLRLRAISAPVMVVKGDGALESEQLARDRPIETILSGPAASIIGALNLSGAPHGTVVDMGGTTTDVAKIKNCEITIDPRGATVGGWETNVRAANILTAGIGGDSYVQLMDGNEISVGPRRVIPLAYLAHQHPQIKDILRDLRRNERAASMRAHPLDFFVFVKDGTNSTYSAEERRAIEILREGPVSRTVLSQGLGAIHPSLIKTERLEATGVIQRSSLTPTDVLHALGEFVAWDAEASSIAVDVFGRMARIGREAAADRILAKAREQMTLQILLKQFAEIEGVKQMPGCEVCKAIVDNMFDGKGADFTSTISLKHPIIAIGAPVKAYFPQIGEMLKSEVIIPDNAEIANAVGAVTANVVIEETILIRPSVDGNFIMHSPLEKREFETLNAAKGYARRQIRSIVRQQGIAAGADTSSVSVMDADRTGLTADGGVVLIESQVRGSVVSKPVLAKL